MGPHRKKRRAESGGRGSTEAIEKRRIARQLNTMLSGGARRGTKLDGRTEKRRRRLIKELVDGRGGRSLKPIDFVAHTHELLELGDTFASLRKQGVKPRKTEQTPEVTRVAQRTQEQYQFRLEAWRMLGIRLSDSSRRAQAGKVARRSSALKKRKGRNVRG